MKRNKAERLLETLAADFGHQSVEAMLADATFDSIVPGICPTCFYTTEVEPDSNSGYCEDCEKQSVVSCLYLAHLI